MKNFISSNHCERPGRIVAIWKGLQSRGLDQRCKMIPSRLAKKEEILLVHTPAFYEKIEKTKAATAEEIRALGGHERSVEYNGVSS